MDGIKAAARVIDAAAAEHRTITAEELATVEQALLEDHVVSRAEAKFLTDRIKRRRFGKEELPAVHALVTRSLFDNADDLTLQIGKQTFTNIRPVADLDLSAGGTLLDAARRIMDENDIDEAYLQTPDGRLFVTHGLPDKRGAMNLDNVKTGYVGKLNDQTVTVVHVDDENNTARQGAVAPLKATGKVVKEASENGIIRGIGEVGAMITAIFVGRAVIENGIRAATGQAANAVQGAVQAAPGVVAPVVGVVGKVTPKGIATGAKTMLKDGLRTTGVVGAVAVIVVGGVAITLAGIGAVKGLLAKPKAETLDMATEPRK